MPFGLISGIASAAVSGINAQNELNYSRERDAKQDELTRWQQEQYIDQRDYDRALQKEIFAREDTAVQRALDDYTNAGFSPLSAVGQNYDAGQAVSSSSVPSLSASNFAGQAMSNVTGQITQLFLQRLAAADKLKEIGAERDAQIQVDEAVHDLRLDEMEQELYNNMRMLDADAGAKEWLMQKQAEIDKDYQSREHTQQKDMAQIQHQNALGQNTHDWQNRVNNASALENPTARAYRHFSADELINSKHKSLRKIGQQLKDAKSDEERDLIQQYLQDYLANEQFTTDKKYDQNLGASNVLTNVLDAVIPF